MVELTQILDFSPDDDEAFLQFEAVCRERLERTTYSLGQNESWSEPRMEYMSRVQGAAEGFGVDPGDRLQRSDGRPLSPDDFDWFNSAALKLVTHIQIRAARRLARDSVELEPADRAKIRADVERLKNRVDAAVDLPADRKEAIKRKLADLLKEIEKPRVKLAVVFVVLAALPQWLNGAQDNVIKLPETIVAIMDVISIATGKEEERRQVLEHYRERKAIEHKPDDKAQPQARKSVLADLDDEIPF